MDKTERLIEQTELLLARVEGLQQALKQLQADLNLHTLALAQELTKARRKPAAAPARPMASRERRSSPRRKGNPVSVDITNGSKTDEPVQGWVVDRSSGGLRLLVDEAVPAGTLLNVRPVKTHESFPWVAVKVKSCYPERKSWNLGCQFVQKLSWEMLQHFG